MRVFGNIFKQIMLTNDLGIEFKMLEFFQENLWSVIGIKDNQLTDVDKQRFIF